MNTSERAVVEKARKMLENDGPGQADHNVSYVLGLLDALMAGREEADGLAGALHRQFTEVDPAAKEPGSKVDLVRNPCFRYRENRPPCTCMSLTKEENWTVCPRHKVT